jgi:predicted dehydrogenase
LPAICPLRSESFFRMNLNIGIVGAGGFAQFAATAFLKVAGIKIVAVTDINEAVAGQMAATFRAAVYVDYEMILKDKNIDLVYIATPPFLHYEQSKMALLAGKHVICEKPAALQVTEAEELRILATSRQLLYVVNLMQRYNHLYAIVERIVNEKLLGNFLHGFFENYASDEKLNMDHWFWDDLKSGGIFIEHGVHFFDMFSGWLGEGNVVCAVQLQRPGIEKKIIDRVQATVLYREGVVNFYHGFDQPGILDRQEMRLQFERGEITLYEWVPVMMKLHGLLEKEELEKLHEMLGTVSVVHHNERPAANQKVRGRFSEIIFDDHVTIEYGNVLEKQNRYQEMLAAMIADQWNWIRDRKHVRVIDSSNAVRSLEMAEQATRIAQIF